MDKIAVLIPCYNESKTVEKVVSDFRRVLPDATVYVYDNNSTDGTAELAAGAGAVVRHEYQQGKGNVMRRMFREIDAEAYILVDGDDTYPAEAAPEMVAAVTGRQADMVVGDRLSSTYYTQNKRPFHNFGNDLVRFCTNHLFGGKIKDIMTGYRAFSYQFVKTYPVLSRGFEIETEMTIHALQRNMQVENVVIDYRDRPEGSESKLNTYSDGFKVLGTIARLFKNYRPFSFFGILAAILAVFGIGFMIPVLGEYFRTGLVPRFPTLIVCCFVLVAALLLFISGIILSSQLAKDARDFEFQLQTVHHWHSEKKYAFPPPPRLSQNSLAPSARVTPHSVGRCREATEGSGPEGLRPQAVGGENFAAVRNISGHGKVLSLRPYGPPPSQREARRSQPANRDTRSAGFLLFGAQWAIIVLYVRTAHTTYNKEGLSREYIHYDENCRIDPVGRFCQPEA